MGRHLSEISRAREQARKALTDWGLSGHTDLAELIVSELATNALRHGAGLITIRLSHSSDCDLRLEVHDYGPGRPSLHQPTADDEQGRGLPLLAALADLHDGTWGVADDHRPPGKTVYVTLTLGI